MREVLVRIMATDQRRRRRSSDIAISLLSLTIPPSSGVYGMRFTESMPVTVSQVVSGSAAEHAGLMVGDFVLELNGHDVTKTAVDGVRSLIKYVEGSALTLNIARPHPTPVTVLEDRKALLAVQTKLASGGLSDRNVHSYKAAVDSALHAAQQILGSLGGEQVVPNAEPKVELGVQEVEVKMYDSDSLSSPPLSSEESEDEQDPLLDFSRDDELSYHPKGKKPMIQSMIEAQRAIEGIQAISHGVQEQKRQRQAKEEKQRQQGLVSTQATFVPSFPRAREPKPTRTEERVEETTKVSIQEPPKSSILVSDTPPETKPTPIAKTRDLEASHESPPPPIPLYNPERPESFFLSNKREYREERKKITHTYESLDKEEVAKLQAQSVQKKPEPLPSTLGVILRSKKVADQLPATEREGHVVDTGGKQKSFTPRPLGSREVKDVSNLETACAGLPESVQDWKREDVGIWLKQLSPTLYKLYFPSFSKHDATGRTLLRLNEAKLKSMDINDYKHCRLLALHISRLKIRQEAFELKELDEENTLTYL